MTRQSKPATPHTFLLDLDGTLIDSFARHGLLLEKILQKTTPDFHLQTADYQAFKRSGANNLQYLAKILGLPEPTAQKICADWVREIEDEEWLRHDKLYPDALPFLRFIKSRGDQIIFLSARQNPKNAHAEVEDLALAPFADDIIFVNKAAKFPTKSAYIAHILKQTSTNLKNRGIMIIGDTEDDFNAASATGIPSYILNRGFRSPEYLAKTFKVPKSFTNLTEVLKEIYEHQND